MPTIRTSPPSLNLTSVTIPVTPRESIRSQIMARVKARLMTISTVSGYATNIGTTVYEGMLIDAEPPVIPSLNFWDGTETGIVEYGMALRSLALTIEAYDQWPDETVPDNLTVAARNMVLDVEWALWRDPVTLRPEPTFGGLAVGMEFTSSQPVIGLKPNLWIGSTSLWDISYRTALGNPYSQTDEEA